MMLKTLNLNYLIDHYFIKQPRLRRFVTALLEHDRDHEVEIAGARLKINSRREHGYLRASRLIQKNGTLRDEFPVLMNLFAILREGDTFVDIGANVGLYSHSIYRLTRLYHNLNIIAIEPHPDTFSRLSSLHDEKISYMNFAIGDTTGDIEFVDGAVSHVFTSVEKINSYSIPDEVTKIPVKRLDDLNLKSKSLVLKIDVEGQEINVLNGAKQLLSNGHIRAVYLDGYDDPSINDLLLGYGFNLYNGRTLKAVSGKTFSLLATLDESMEH